jgi:hypothetical protein
VQDGQAVAIDVFNDRELVQKLVRHTQWRSKNARG